MRLRRPARATSCAAVGVVAALAGCGGGRDAESSPATDGVAEAVAAAPATPTAVAPLGPRQYVVVVDTLVERDAPRRNGAAMNRIYRGQVVTVSDSVKGWARVTEPQLDARWVEWRGLGRERLAPKPGPVMAPSPLDARIAPDAIPAVGQGGLAREDVAILRRGARHMLATGRCNRVDLADKSVSRPGIYYVSCAGENQFFTTADLPD